MPIRCFFTFFVAVVVSLAANAGPVKFSSEAEVKVPDGYTYELEEGGKTIVLRSPKPGLFELRLTVISLLAYAVTRPAIAEDFIVDYAKKKGRNVNRVKGSSIVGFMEPGAPTSADGETLQNMHGVFAVGFAYAAMTLTFPTNSAEDPDLRAFIGGGMEAILATLRYAGS